MSDTPRRATRASRGEAGRTGSCRRHGAGAGVLSSRKREALATFSGFGDVTTFPEPVVNISEKLGAGVVGGADMPRARRGAECDRAKKHFSVESRFFLSARFAADGSPSLVARALETVARPRDPARRRRRRCRRPRRAARRARPPAAKSASPPPLASRGRRGISRRHRVVVNDGGRERGDVRRGARPRPRATHPRRASSPSSSPRRRRRVRRAPRSPRGRPPFRRRRRRRRRRSKSKPRVDERSLAVVSPLPASRPAVVPRARARRGEVRQDASARGRREGLLREGHAAERHREDRRRRRGRAGASSIDRRSPSLSFNTLTSSSSLPRSLVLPSSSFFPPSIPCSPR